MHTSYINSRFFDFHAKDCYRIVYHLNTLEQLKEIKRRVDEIVRVVYVVTPEMTKEDIDYIADFCKESDEIEELSFRQMVDSDFNPSFHLHDYLREGHKKRWWYIEQCDYNLYYCENRIYTKFEDVGKSENFII